MKLNIGCGEWRIPGYRNLDIFDSLACDEVIDCSHIVENHPEWVGTIDEILGMHVFEHFSKEDAHHALQEYYQLLKKGGKLILELPDLPRLCAMAQEKQDDLTIAYIFGSQDRDGQMHKWGWGEKTMWQALIDAGFEDITMYPGTDIHAKERPCFRVEAVK